MIVGKICSEQEEEGEYIDEEEEEVGGGGRGGEKDEDGMEQEKGTENGDDLEGVLNEQKMEWKNKVC